MDNLSPEEITLEAIAVAKKKAALSVPKMLVRGMLAGVLLGYATSLVMVLLSQGALPIVGAVIFPVGFVVLVLLGCELSTGNFALLPLGVMAGEVSIKKTARNWFWVYLGNLAGSLLYAVLFYLAITNIGKTDGGAIAELVRQAAQKKTLAYATAGTAGWFTAFIKGILCNWMVTLGAVLALSSRSTIGRIVAMWLPITIFFAHGYEHSVVNMYLIPAGMMLGAPVSIGKWLLWNQLPVTLGNIFAGVFLTALPLYFAHAKKTTAQAAVVVEDAEIECVPEVSATY
jgi:formate/nitrite transporter